MDLQEKIKYSEELIDKYINEVSITAQGVNAAANFGSMASSVSGELRRGYDWAQQKIKEKVRKRMLAKQEKERMKKERMRLAMKAKQDRQNQMGPTK